MQLVTLNIPIISTYMNINTHSRHKSNYLYVQKSTTKIVGVTVATVVLSPSLFSLTVHPSFSLLSLHWLKHTCSFFHPLADCLFLCIYSWGFSLYLSGSFVVQLFQVCPSPPPTSPISLMHLFFILVLRLFNCHTNYIRFSYNPVNSMNSPNCHVNHIQ